MSGNSIDPFPVVLLGLVAVGLVVAFGASIIMPAQGVSATYGSADSGKTVTLSEGTVLKVILDENPTTGYSWNTSVSSGLRVTDSNYVQGGSPGLVGAGGTHEWTVKAAGKGEQQFSAIYKRPWGPVTGSETTFTLNVVVS